jgi:uncharacterized membrane protein required for colicin V production
MPRTDIIVGVLVVLAVISGVRAGVVARLFAWLGVIGGFLLLPVVLPRVNVLFTPSTAMRLLLFNVVAGFVVVLLAALLGRIVGRVLRIGVNLTPLSLFDRVGGVLLSVAIVGFGIASVLHAAAKLPSALGDDVRQSTSYTLLVERDTVPTRWIDLLPTTLFDRLPNGSAEPET